MYKIKAPLGERFGLPFAGTVATNPRRCFSRIAIISRVSIAFLIRLEIAEPIMLRMDAHIVAIDGSTRQSIAWMRRFLALPNFNIVSQPVSLVCEAIIDGSCSIIVISSNPAHHRPAILLCHRAQTLEQSISLLPTARIRGHKEVIEKAASRREEWPGKCARPTSFPPPFSATKPHVS